MAADNPWFLLSAGSCGVFWLIAYVLIIRRSFIDQSYGMPLIPLCVNFGYEIIFGAVWPDEYPMYIVNLTWAGFDAVMVYQYLRFGKREWPEHYPRALFYPAFLAVLAMVVIGIVTLTIDTQDYHGGNLTGWGAQLILSAGSILMLLRRSGPEGQSMYIGILRMVGTLCLIYAQESYERPFMFLRFVYVAAPLLDITYLWLLYRTLDARGMSPWRRI